MALSEASFYRKLSDSLICVAKSKEIKINDVNQSG